MHSIAHANSLRRERACCRRIHGGAAGFKPAWGSLRFVNVSSTAATSMLDTAREAKYIVIAHTTPDARVARFIRGFWNGKRRATLANR
eukprot:3580087-Pleurochrysis_carterae.AAC.2